MELTKKNIEEYIHRFMEGETTLAEEQAIYRFFRSGDVPEHLKVYAPMFAWYEEGMPEEKKMEDSTIKRNTFWKRIPLGVWSMGVAAMLVIGIGLGVLSGLDKDMEDEWSCYEGSYVEVNGKRITDVKEIMPVILETLAEAERMEKQMEDRWEAIRLSEEKIKESENKLANF
ncbi:MAG: hypothetical protein IKW37_04440 [Bacteroidaceae bacterium]|nr:hypothetical protein [Bacteroidaceae bacterium]